MSFREEINLLSEDSEDDKESVKKPPLSLYDRLKARQLDQNNSPPQINKQEHVKYVETSQIIDLLSPITVIQETRTLPPQDLPSFSLISPGTLLIESISNLSYEEQTVEGILEQENNQSRMPSQSLFSMLDQKQKEIQSKTNNFQPISISKLPSNAIPIKQTNNLTANIEDIIPNILKAHTNQSDVPSSSQTQTNKPTRKRKITTTKTNKNNDIIDDSDSQSVGSLHSTSSSHSQTSTKNASNFSQDTEASNFSTTSQNNSQEVVLIAPQENISYEIYLIVDKRERSNALIQASLCSAGIKCELANLSVGDFLWVAKPTNGSFETHSLVLDCVIERKTIPDLGSSILDGRFLDQIRRLKSTSCQTCMYFVEGEHLAIPMAQQRSITPQHLKSAMITVHVDHNIHVTRTRGMDHTISLLQYLHKQIETRFYSKLLTFRTSPTPSTSPLLYQTYANYQILYGKKSASTLQELFGYQLRQINGCSANSSTAIMTRFQTTANFMNFLHFTDPFRATNILENLSKDGSNKGRIGPKLAQKIRKIYTQEY